MQKHVCVTVLVTSVGHIVKVSALTECVHAATKVQRYTHSVLVVQYVRDICHHALQMTEYNY